VNLNHSKSYIDSSVIQNNSKTPTNNNTISRGLQNPRIIDKKFNLGGSSQPKNLASGDNSNQTSQRYLQKENVIEQVATST
jgi:hypothetical protein